MDELVTAAAGALAPFAGAGASAVADGYAEEVGAELYRFARSLISKLGYRIRGSDEPAVIAAIQEGLADKVLQQEDLKTLLALHHASAGSSATVGRIKSKNVFVGTTNIKHFRA